MTDELQTLFPEVDCQGYELFPFKAKSLGAMSRLFASTVAEIDIAEGIESDLTGLALLIDARLGEQSEKFLRACMPLTVYEKFSIEEDAEVYLSVYAEALRVNQDFFSKLLNSFDLVKQMKPAASNPPES